MVVVVAVVAVAARHLRAAEDVGVALVVGVRDQRRPRHLEQHPDVAAALQPQEGVGAAGDVVVDRRDDRVRVLLGEGQVRGVEARVETPQPRRDIRTVVGEVR